MSNKAFGTAVASDNIGPGCESGNRLSQNTNLPLIYTPRKEENKEKGAGNGLVLNWELKRCLSIGQIVRGQTVMAPFKHRQDEKDPFPSRMKGKSFFTKAAVINAEFLSFHPNRQSEFFYHFYLFTKLF